MPGWDQDDHAAAFKTFLKSCGRVVAAARERTAADKVPPPPAALVAACAAASQLAGPVGKAEAKAFFERHFTANAVAHNGPRGLLTGYYEPLLQGSRTAQGIFQTPVYKRPPDLVNLVDDVPLARVTVWCPSGLAQHLSLADVERSTFHELLRVPLGGATQTIDAQSSLFDAAFARALPPCMRNPSLSLGSRIGFRHEIQRRSARDELFSFFAFLELPHNAARMLHYPPAHVPLVDRFSFFWVLHEVGNAGKTQR